MPVFDSLARFKNVGDQEADALVDNVAARYGVALLFDLPRLVGRWTPGTPFKGIPNEVIDYLQRPYEVPGWVDRAAVLRAQRRYQAEAQVGQIVLGAYSLPIVFLNPEVTVTLMGTGQLMQHTLRRLAETHHFVRTAMAVGALVEPGTSQQWMRKVRFTHAVIRRLDRERSGPGDATQGRAWQHPLQVRHLKRNESLAAGVPLDQSELTWVLLTFSWVLVDGLEELGYGLNAREREDHIHLWALAGHMIGILEELLPGGPQAPAAEAGPLFRALRDRLLERGDPLDKVLPGDPEARLLMAALLTVLTEVQRHAVPPSLRQWLKRFGWLDAAVQNIPRVLVRRLCGNEAAALLHVGRGPLLYWLVAQIALRVLDLRTWNDQVPPHLRKQFFGE